MSQWFSKRGEKNRERRREALSAYLDGELSARERARIERELAQDAALRAELADLRRTVQMVRSLPTLPVPRSFTLDPAIYGRTQPRRIYLYPIMRAATVLVMVTFVFLTAITFFAAAPATAPSEEVALQEVEVTRVVEKEVVVETVEVEREAPAAEPAAEDFATEAPMVEMAAETVVETVEEELAVEAEPEAAAPVEMPAAEAPPPDAAPSATPTAPPEAGVGAGEPSPSAEASPTVEPTLEPTVAVAPRVAEDSVEAPSPEPITVVEQPPEAPLPEPTPTEPVEQPQEEPGQDWLEQIDWLLVGAGLLGAGLLVVTLLARRFGW